MDAKQEMKGLRYSFRYAIAGFLYCVNNERNMRIHLSVCAILSVFSYYYGLSASEFILFWIICGLVMVMEMVNTAIETLVDLASPAYHRLARIAKDIAAGAVLLMAMVAVGVGCYLYLDIPRLWATVLSLIEQPHRIILLSGMLLLALVFILKGFGLVPKAVKQMKDTFQNKP